MVNEHKDTVKEELLKIFEDAFQHDGFSDFHVEIKILKRKQKEVIIHYGKQYRYVVDYLNQEFENTEQEVKPKFLAVDR